MGGIRTGYLTMTWITLTTRAGDPHPDGHPAEVRDRQPRKAGDARWSGFGFGTPTLDWTQSSHVHPETDLAT
jgi:hypothetical protein